MNAWIQFACAAVLAVILANPLCVCSAESMPAPQKSCCEKTTGESGIPIAPCDCEGSYHESLFLKPENNSQGQTAFIVQSPTHSPATTVTHRPPQPARAASPGHGPPLRHWLAVYRL